MKGTPTTNEQVAKVMELYGKSMSGRAISEATGIPRSTVGRIIGGNAMATASKAAAPKLQKKQTKAAPAKLSAYSFTPFQAPEGSPICNATATGFYSGSELSYRQPSRA